MPSWMRIAGRVLTVLSLIGIIAAAFLSAPAWLVAILAGIGIGGVILGVSAGAPGEPEMERILEAVAELEALAGIRPDRLNTDTSPRGRVADAGRRALESVAALRASMLETEGRAVAIDALLDAVDEPILATDEEGLIRVANAAARGLLDLRSAALLGRPVEEVFTQSEVHRIIAGAGGGSATRDEVRVTRPEGVRTWEISAVPYGAERKGVVLTLQDVTERSLALQIKTDFVANASHELRTPISAIRAALETLETLGDDDEAMRVRLMGMLGSHTLRLEELVRDLLDLSKLESTDADLRFEVFPATALAASLGETFQNVCRERRLTLRFELAPELERLRTDRNLLQLILSNLIDNACKFAFEGTEVVVSGQPLPGAGVRLEVIDRGIGIPLSQQQRIFERFFQVDAARTGGPKRGTGLGLSIVKHAVRRLGGTIRVNSVWQQGTTMVVEIPRGLEARSAAGSLPVA